MKTVGFVAKCVAGAVVLGLIVFGIVRLADSWAESDRAEFARFCDKLGALPDHQHGVCIKDKRIVYSQ